MLPEYSYPTERRKSWTSHLWSGQILWENPQTILENFCDQIIGPGPWEDLPCMLELNKDHFNFGKDPRELFQYLGIFSPQTNMIDKIILGES